MAKVSQKAAFIGLLGLIGTLSFFATLFLLPDFSNTPNSTAPSRAFASYDFGPSAGANVKHLRNGWLDVTSRCRWTAGRAELKLPATSNLSQNILLVVEADGLVSERRPKQDVNFILNGSLIGKLKFTHTGAVQPQKFSVSPALVKARPDGLHVAFIEQNPASLLTTNLGSDPAKKSICLRRISLQLDKV